MPRPHCGMLGTLGVGGGGLGGLGLQAKGLHDLLQSLFVDEEVSRGLRHHHLGQEHLLETSDPLLRQDQGGLDDVGGDEVHLRLSQQDQNPPEERGRSHQVLPAIELVHLGVGAGEAGALQAAGPAGVLAGSSSSQTTR